MIQIHEIGKEQGFIGAGRAWSSVGLAGWPRCCVELRFEKIERERFMDSAAVTRVDVANVRDDTQIIRIALPWTGYEGISAALGDAINVRLAYDGETLEIMSPEYTHEKIARFIAAILVYALDAWGIDYEDTGSTTFRRKPVGGFAGDASFYVTNAAMIRGLRDIDLALHPAPDLVLEVDVANRRMDKEAIDAACGVSEFWRYDDVAELRVLGLEGGAYVPVDASRVIRGLPVRMVAAFIDRFNRGEARPSIVASIQQWLRDNRHLHADQAGD